MTGLRENALALGFNNWRVTLTDRQPKFLVTKWSRFGHKRLVTLVLLKY